MKLLLIGFVVAVIVIVGVVVVLLKPSVEVSTSVTPISPSGEQPSSQPKEAPPPTQAPPFVPVSGITITIRDCKADPYILEAQRGSKISLINADAQDHTLFLAKPTGGIELALPANGSFELEIDSSFLMNFTYNYSCDDKLLPYGGAIYVTK